MTSRYQGHLALPEVGPEGQARLGRASVLCVGTGGLGSPAALYLAAAGIGRLGLVDADVVDVSNLHRQILFRTADVGLSKVETAAAALRALNPEIEVVAHPARLTSRNADALLAGYDVIVDGTDNFPTRYLINDVCVRLGKPDVWASIFRFEGQVAVFDALRGPCYRCLFPAIPPDDEIPACAVAGVLGVLPGVLGTTQALEAIKLVLGVGKPLIGRLLTFDALALAWHELRLEKDPDCPACGTGILAVEPLVLDPIELQARLPEVVLVDCREAHEWEICGLEGSLRIPLGELGARVGELPRDKDVVLVCHHGPRARYAAALLMAAGLPRVAYLEGGLHAWASDVDPTMRRY
ncbi:MAG: moeB2 [Cyanobacteria bacterium RYN_339]|nr:moeB2 [Cyanobacteria bacterium RYN_339]